MRVLLANHTPLDGSGSGTYTALLATALDRKGHEVAVIAPRSRFQGSPVIENMFPVLGLREDFPSFTGHPQSHSRYDSYSPSELARLEGCWEENFRRVISIWGPSIIHTQHLWLVSAAAVKCHPTVVATSHGSELSLAEKHPRFSGVRKFAPMNGSEACLRAIIYVSEFVQSSAMAILGDLAPPGLVSHNPYNSNIFHFSSGGCVDVTPTIGFAGRLVRYKQADQFLAVVKKLGADYPTLRAWIAGDGPERVELESVAAREGLSERVSFVGGLPQSQLANLYSASRVIVLCSREEPFGLVALEAAACGTRVVVPDSGGLAELVRAPYIVGFPVGDTDQLVRLTRELISSCPSVAERQCRSRFIERQYSLAAYVSALEAVYHRAWRETQS